MGWAQNADRAERHLKTWGHWEKVGWAKVFRVLAFSDLRFGPGPGVGQHGDRLSGELPGRREGARIESKGAWQSLQGRDAVRDEALGAQPKVTTGNTAARPELKGQQNPVMAGGGEGWRWWWLGPTGGVTRSVEVASLRPGLRTEC